jgi:hypothetical protein
MDNAKNIPGLCHYQFNDSNGKTGRIKIGRNRKKNKNDEENKPKETNQK